CWRTSTAAGRARSIPSSPNAPTEPSWAGASVTGGGALRGSFRAGLLGEREGAHQRWRHLRLRRLLRWRQLELFELVLRLDCQRLGAQRSDARIVEGAATGEALAGGDVGEFARRGQRTLLGAADDLGAWRRADDAVVADTLAGGPLVEDHRVADGVVGAARAAEGGRADGGAGLRCSGTGEQQQRGQTGGSRCGSEKTKQGLRLRRSRHGLSPPLRAARTTESLSAT